MDNTTKIILSCCCGKSTGQIAVEATRQLSIEGLGQIGSIFSIILHGDIADPPLHSRTESLVLVEGCSLRCAKNVLDKYGVTYHHSLVITDLGIEPSDSLEYLSTDLELAKDGVRAVCAEYSTDPVQSCMCGMAS